MKRLGFAFLLILLVGLLPWAATSQNENGEEKTFGEPIRFLDVTVSEDADFVTVYNGDGLVWKFRQDTAGYDVVLTDGSVLIQDERWILEYLDGSNWKMRGQPRYVTWERLSSYHVVVKRFYDDFLGTTFNVSYSFHGGDRTKLAVEAQIGQAAEYRLVWKASGVNTTNVLDEPTYHRVSFWDLPDQSFDFDYRDVYESFGDITVTEIEPWANNHKIDQVFNVGYLDVGFFTLDPTFGLTGTGSFEGSAGANEKWGCNYTITEDGTGSKISVYLKKSTAGSCNVKASIYNMTGQGNDMDNAPLVASGSDTGTCTDAWSWVNVTVSASVYGNKGYVIAWKSDAAVKYKYNDAAAGVNRTQGKVETYGDAFPDPYGTVSSNQERIICSFITYTASGDSTKPTYANISASETKAGQASIFSCNWTDETGLSHYIFGTNNTGSWANDTEVAFSGGSWANVTKTLNSTVGQVVGYRWWANDTSDNWNNTGIQTLTVTSNPPTIAEFSSPETVYSDTTFDIQVRVDDYDGVATFTNATIELTGDVILLWEASGDTFTEHQDPYSYYTLSASECLRTSVNSTSLELMFRGKLSANYPQGSKDVVAANTKVYDSSDVSGSGSHTGLFNFQVKSDQGGGGGGGGGAAGELPTYSPPEVAEPAYKALGLGAVAILIGGAYLYHQYEQKPSLAKTRKKMKQKEKQRRKKPKWKEKGFW